MVSTNEMKSSKKEKAPADDTTTEEGFGNRAVPTWPWAIYDDAVSPQLRIRPGSSIYYVH